MKGQGIMDLRANEGLDNVRRRHVKHVIVDDGSGIVPEHSKQEDGAKEGKKLSSEYEFIKWKGAFTPHFPIIA